MSITHVLNLESGMVTSIRGAERGKPHWSGVVKVQRGLDSPGLVLIYNESRTIMHQQAMPPQLRGMFFPDEWKFYADATYDRGVLKINNRTSERSW